MQFYYGLYLIVMVLFFITKLNRNSRKSFLITVGVLLSFVIMFRSKDVGTDTATYYYIFKQVGAGVIPIISAELEPLFTLFNKIVYIIIPMPEVMVALIALVTIVGIFIYIYKYSRDYFLSTLLFVGFCYYFLAFNISRQFLGFMIVLLALNFYQKGNKKIFYFLMLVSFFVHYASIIWIGIVLLEKLNLNKRKMFILIVLLPIILTIGIQGLMYILSFTKFLKYILNSSAVTRSTGYYVFLLLKIIMFILFNFFRKENVKSKEEIIIQYSLLMDISLSFLLPFYSFVGRIIYFFEPYVIISYPYILKKVIHIKPYWIVYIVFGLMGIVLMGNLLEGNSLYGIIPYTFLFE